MLDDNPNYRTSIPEHATPKVKGKRLNKTPTEIDYYVAGELVGRRGFDYNGVIEWEFSFRNGGQHGWAYTWHDGRLASAEPWENGVAHGTASQWDGEGSLMGRYAMERGTGVDLWRQENFGKPGNHLSEAYCYRSGLRHGGEWRFCEGRLLYEIQWFDGKRNGVERSWNFKGGLCRGYPRYFVNDAQVTRRHYLRARISDPTLPSCSKEDNAPVREFPSEVQQSL